MSSKVTVTIVNVTLYPQGKGVTFTGMSQGAANKLITALSDHTSFDYRITVTGDRRQPKLIGF